MCLIEMITLFPFSGGFVYLAGRFLDPSAQFALGCECHLSWGPLVPKY